MPALLTPLALALGALAIPIVMLYMLRLRREELPISSTFLWQKLVRDREANAPWQRLRLSWLLFLQLLVLAALVLALARPFTTVKTITTGRIVLLLDASASMQATDDPPSRFERARAIGLDLVDTLGADDTMTVIRVAEVPEVLAAASRDKLVLRQAIRSAKPSSAAADWSAAMTLAAAGAVGVDELKVVIVTDGGLPADLPTVPGDVRFVSVGTRSDNLAIAALATAALPGQAPQVFLRIANYGAQDSDVIVDLRLDQSDTLFTARRFTIPATGYRDVFELELPAEYETLTAQLTLPSTSTAVDYLALDDRAYAVRDRSGAGRVLLVSEGNRFVEQILRSLRGVELFMTKPAETLPRGEFDLVVLDGVLPANLPDADLLVINPPRSTDFFTLGDALRPSGPLTAAPDDPRTRNLGVFLETVNLSSFRPVSGAAWGTMLVEVDGYPLVIAGELGDRQIALLPFDARYPNTDMVLQPAWPLLMAELMAWFSPPRVTDVTASLPPGAPVTIRFIDDADRAVILRPDGGRTVIEGQTGQAVFAETRVPGLYRVDLQRAGRLVRSERFAVNLFDPAESRIAPRPSVTIGTSTLARDTREESGRREFWPWVAAFGLAVLMIEWWVYHRSLWRVPRGAGVRTGRAQRLRWAALRRWRVQRRAR